MNKTLKKEVFIKSFDWSQRFSRADQKWGKKSDFRFSVCAAVSSVLRTAPAAGLVFRMALATTRLQ